LYKRDRTEPMRQCLGCKLVLPKRELLRLVRLPSGAVSYDHDQHANGRGGYICPNLPCLRKAFKSRNQRFNLSAADMKTLVETIKRQYTGGIERALKRADKMGYRDDTAIKDDYPYMPALMRDLKLLERLSSEVL
jgi:uncharacterized protein